MQLSLLLPVGFNNKISSYMLTWNSYWLKHVLEKIILNSLKMVTESYEPDFIKSELETHLEILRCMKIEPSSESLVFFLMSISIFKLSTTLVLLLHQVALVIKFVLLMPATNAISERSASAMHRIKYNL